jgi:hypothetical protein
MAGLVAAIYVLLAAPSPPPHAGRVGGQDVDARDKRGHDGGNGLTAR